MKALLLAAGLGSRLRPLTYELPKCLVPIKGLPVLGHWLHLLEKHGYDEVLINTGYRAKRVQDFLATFYSPLRIVTTLERRLLGTAGTIRRNWDFFATEESFLVAHVDNFTNADLTDFRLTAGDRLDEDFPVAMGLFRCPRPRDCGIVEIDGEGVISGFHEKVDDPPGDLANAGLYLCHRSLKTWLDEACGGREAGREPGRPAPQGPEIDLCRDVIAKLEGRMIGWSIGGAFLIDIGNLEAYETANLDPAYRLEFPANRADVSSLLESYATERKELRPRRYSGSSSSARDR